MIHIDTILDSKDMLIEQWGKKAEEALAIVNACDPEKDKDVYHLAVGKLSAYVHCSCMLDSEITGITDGA